MGIIVLIKQSKTQDSERSSNLFKANSKEGMGDKELWKKKVMGGKKWWETGSDGRLEMMEDRLIWFHLFISQV